MPDELAHDSEVHIHQGRSTYIRRLCVEGGGTYLGRSVAPAPNSGLRVSQGTLTGRQKSAEGVVSGVG